MWKNSEQKFHVYISTDYVRMTKYRGKLIFVVMWVKKNKKCLVQTLILPLNFIFFA
jgi:hypothetical protein